jgi:hypothetical protein
MKQLVTENIIVDSTEIHAVKKGTLISNNTPLDPASLELIRISEYNDFIKVLRSVIERRFLTKSKLEMQAALLEPNKFLLDGDGLMITLLENKAKHIYNILRIIPGFISILKSKIIPIASYNTQLLQLLLGLDNIKLLYNNEQFISLLDNPIENKDTIISIMISCMIHNSFIGQNVDRRVNRTRKQRRH